MSLQQFGTQHHKHPDETTRTHDETNNPQDGIDPLSSSEMYTGIKMFKKERGGQPICGTIDLQSSGGQTCTNSITTSCDHSNANTDPNGEHRLVKHDTLVMNTSTILRILKCDTIQIRNKHYISLTTNRKTTYANNSMIQLKGDLFASKKEVLYGQFDFIETSRIVHTTIDMTEDINVGDIIGVRMPGNVLEFESVIVARPDQYTLVLNQPYLGSDLIGYSGHLVYRRQAESGRTLGTILGETILIKSTSIAKSTKKLTTSTTPGTTVKKGYQLKLQVENKLEGSSICTDIMEQYHTLIRMIGTTVLHVTAVDSTFVKVDRKYCNDDHIGMKMYRNVIRNQPKLKEKLIHNMTELPGTVAVGNGSFIAVTTRNVCPAVPSGSRIQIADQICVVEDCRPAMLTMKCPTKNGAWMSKYTGVNYLVYLLRPHKYGLTNGLTNGLINGTKKKEMYDIGDRCLQDLRGLSSEKLRCPTLACIERIQAMECAVHVDCAKKLVKWKSTERNLNCEKVKPTTLPTDIIPRTIRNKPDKDRWGFFTRL